LVGLDIRNPKIGTYLQVPSMGLTNYLWLNKYIPLTMPIHKKGYGYVYGHCVEVDETLLEKDF
jgi:hypothetical protein